MPEREKQNMNRRSFVNLFFGGGILAFLAAAFYPVVKFLIPPSVAEAPQNNVVAASTDELEPNSGKIFKFGNKPGILIRLDSGEYRSFTAVCTHLACTVQYRPDFKHIWCACHNGHYDLNGQVVSGPPPRPLEEYAVFIRGKDIVVAKEQRS